MTPEQREFIERICQWMRFVGCGFMVERLMKWAEICATPQSLAQNILKREKAK